jgi:hypothetical protein
MFIFTALPISQDIFQVEQKQLEQRGWRLGEERRGGKGFWPDISDSAVVVSRR